jgi:hypothetical protein
MLGKVKAAWDRFTGMASLKAQLWKVNLALDATHFRHRAECERLQAELELARKQRDQWQADCKANYNDQMRVILDLESELQTAKKTAALHCSLIAILRATNRDLDKRITGLECQFPDSDCCPAPENTAKPENDTPDRCTESAECTKRDGCTFVDARVAARRLEGWQGHGTGRWGLGAAIDIEAIEQRLSALEAKP